MIWLASFPRSGNTFFRNILFEVYGLESSTFHREDNYPMDENYAAYPFVKTHLLPDQLPEEHRAAPKVYLVRDGRDALVSLAHHRKDIIEPGTDFYTNLLEATLALGGSYFGGWSENVKQWTAEADVIIRYEDLIEDPLREVEKLRKVVDLPEPNRERLPTFEKLKFGQPQYGSGATFLAQEEEVAALAQKNFRKGRAGAWKEEMPATLLPLVYELHGKTLEHFDYWRGHEPGKSLTPVRVLMEANKLSDATMDGVRRYQVELLQALQALQFQLPTFFTVDCMIGDTIRPLDAVIEMLNKEVESGIENEVTDEDFLQEEALSGYESLLLQFKGWLANNIPLSIYEPMRRLYTRSPARSILHWLSINIRRFRSRAERKRIIQSYDLVHIPLPQNYFFIKHFKLPVVGTVHDLTHLVFPEFHERHNIKLSEAGMRFLQKVNARIIAVSNATKQDILHQYSIRENDVQVVYEAANGDLFHPIKDPAHLRLVRDRYRIPEGPYLVSLSTIEPRKNLANTLAAFIQLKSTGGAYEDLTFVVCGKRGWKVDALYDREHPYASSIYFTGYVEDEDLAALYSGAKALCYVAHYEGFGLPPLEAMLCGTPVLYGDNSSMPEVVRDGGIGVDAGSIEAIRAGMEQILRADEAALRKTALRRARGFSWLRTAYETFLTYQQARK
ncbi:glycosyltransferase [Phaeodactylibacter sp.]|uniref:glycosyltransferase n=1 Tax=Phaeodactylibacter sp. TaxID=1940289 RepID=UPI0025DB2981|nr:glycosyltransferase [Phaeodactylibacter sp.]MCI4648061.1 glycosyltransferase [Phaeodactylibacter sp.]MCI5092354.1 glycosyltransferase [Phaeodactylibacter sp.]